MKTFGQHSKELEEAPVNTQSITGLKMMADRMVRKLSNWSLLNSYFIDLVSLVQPS